MSSVHLKSVEQGLSDFNEMFNQSGYHRFYKTKVEELHDYIASKDTTDYVKALFKNNLSELQKMYEDTKQRMEQMVLKTTKGTNALISALSRMLAEVWDDRPYTILSKVLGRMPPEDLTGEEKAVIIDQESTSYCPIFLREIDIVRPLIMECTVHTSALYHFKDMWLPMTHEELTIAAPFLRGITDGVQLCAVCRIVKDCIYSKQEAQLKKLLPHLPAPGDRAQWLKQQLTALNILKEFPK